MTSEITTKPIPLSIAESAALAECEATIERGRQAFIEVGNALAAIRGIVFRFPLSASSERRP